jgi:hypothetical protein
VTKNIGEEIYALAAKIPEKFEERDCCANAPRQCLGMCAVVRQILFLCFSKRYARCHRLKKDELVQVELQVLTARAMVDNSPL